ncbi:SPX-domain-containing protein [Pseudovirgaria hyperparasitica]|uniref:SPX-domain-containing protein n=1 Tax=Pseudovirgaria hyperparasitica TaxID=470096 RepID=A0A6A6W020_9PEZI|nr:SPX-domain-containing protein [Pseudovirgaria hyperparasitica]KAF2754411.1 SPX-domain-containing protein [Pseudovirgaria hyperparasitica]
MRFGSTLRKSVYGPWKDKYIDYGKLKKLLKESEGDGSPIERDEDEWTEEDESNFVEELVNVQLEKVNDFQAQTYQKLRDRTSACENDLEPLSLRPQGSEDSKDQDVITKSSATREVSDDERETILKKTLKELDSVTKEVNELEKYSRINYTGFLKAAKKHDRKRGHMYRVRPLLQVRLAALPFNSEDYSPLLYKLSAMYSFVRQSLEGKKEGLSFSEGQTGGETFVSHKFWVHPENLLEVKTVILRRLPVLVYNPQTSKIAEGSQRDPTITSIYFDNPNFSLYTDKVDHKPNAASLRLRWYGQLAEKPEILVEKKIIKEGDVSEEQRFSTKDKYVQGFITRDNRLEKNVKKLEDRFGEDSAHVQDYKTAVNDISQLIQDAKLEPMVRANYTRTAFQIPGDDRVRISLDTNLSLIREDALDQSRPCRDPAEWHRTDIDNNEMEYPFSGVKKGEINRFPFALLEIRIKGNKNYEWVSDLMDSHLVKTAPRFSKFVHGIAVLFEDYVNSFPFWLSEVETDIRRDPQKAFEEEQERKAKAAEDDVAVGSLFGTQSSLARQSFQPAMGSPIRSPASRSAPSRPGKATAEMARKASMAAITRESGKDAAIEDEDSDDDGVQGKRTKRSRTGIRSFIPSFSNSKYGQSKRFGNAKLPPGLVEPTNWLKDRGEVIVEPKVWLANQRTFVKWQHVAVLLASLSLGLYNAAGVDNTVAVTLAYVYTALAIFILGWGWAIYMYRSKLIRERSGKDFDSVIGPVVICVGLAVALVLNFAFKYRAALEQRNDHHHHNTTIQV